MIAPPRLTFPIALAVPLSANHMFPSGAGPMSSGFAPAFMPVEYSVITPAGVIRPIAFVVP